MIYDIKSVNTQKQTSTQKIQSIHNNNKRTHTKSEGTVLVLLLFVTDSVSYSTQTKNSHLTASLKHPCHRIGRN